MKILSTLLSISLLITSPSWKTNFEEGRAEAIKNNKLLLVNFSGSDWCLPCMQLKKTIFESEEFTSYASEDLVLVHADFPRQNKHRLSPDQKKMNEELASRFDPDGKFPYTVLMTGGGKILRQWDGLPDISGKQFVDEIRQYANH